MAKTSENKPAVEPVPERMYTARDLEKLLDWIRDESPYYPNGMNGWGCRGYSPYMEVKPGTILRGFNEFLDQQTKPKSKVPSQPAAKK